MKLNNLITGLLILKKYYSDEDSCTIGANRDVVYLYPTGCLVSPSDVKALRMLGWRQSGDVDEAPLDTYAPGENWVAYV